jgi:hypothetical protein
MTRRELFAWAWILCAVAVGLAAILVALAAIAQGLGAMVNAG